MKEIIVKIPEESSALVTALLEKLGAEVNEKRVKKSAAAGKKPMKRKKQRKISPVYLFGKWKNLDIDAKKLRQEAWDRSRKSW